MESLERFLEAYGFVRLIGDMYPEIMKKDIHILIKEGVVNGKIDENSQLGKVLIEICKIDENIYGKLRDTVLERFSKSAGLR